MNTSRRESGPFRHKLYFQVNEIDEICVEALNKSGCFPKEPGPVDVERFVEKHFRCESGYEALPDDVMGFTAFDKTGKVIGVRVQSSLEDGTQTGERRVRSTWAHEAGHGLLHATLFMEIPGEETFFTSSDSNVFNNRILCRNADIKAVTSRYDGRWWEWQANRCIGGLLLPKTLVLEALDPFLNQSVVTGNPSLNNSNRQRAELHIATSFNVNSTVARIRISEMFPQKNAAQLEF
jgi:hypothetical protein